MLLSDSIDQSKVELSENALTTIAAVADLIQRIKSEKKTKDSDQVIFKNLFHVLLEEADFTIAFTNTGIPKGDSFFDETINILKNKILPLVHSPKDVRSIIHELLRGQEDFETLASFIQNPTDNSLLFTKSEKTETLSVLRIQLIKAIEITSYRIAALGMDDDVYTRAGKEEALLTPFMEQNREINELLCNIEAGNTEKALEDLAQSKIMLRQCLDNITLLDKGAEKNGASLRQTFILRKLELLIERLSKLLPALCYEDNDKAFDDLLVLLHTIVLAETKEKNLSYFFSRNINLIAYRITENKRKTGEHYIAANRNEYWDLFISACGGGFVVSFLVILKLLAHEAELPMLWEGLVYSMIYAIGFVAIHMLHFTLATKQPAMTAAYIAASLDDVSKDAARHEDFAAMIAMVSRSQFISFAGNLLVVFPFSLFWILILNVCSSHAILSPEEGSAFLNSIHPGHSLSLLYAAIAGLLLFVAGIISGFGDNKAVVSKIGARIEAHPFLKKRIAKERLHKIATYLEQNMGPLSGNIALAFFLGMAGFIGKISGLPFDIRHITFSTGNLALGFYGTDFQADWSFVLACLAGVGMIGLFNFIFSFLPALQVAARSRGLRLKDYPDLLWAVLKYFKKHPHHFIFPPRKEKKVSEIVSA